MVFAALAVATLGLTLLGLNFVRVYDNQLVRQTESELIAQGAALATSFSAASTRDAAVPPCLPVTAPWPFHVPKDSPLRPILPTLTASSEVGPPPTDAPRATEFPDPSMRRVGEDFAPQLVATSRATLASIRIVDTRGTVVATSNSGIGTSLAYHREVQEALQGAPASALRERLGDPPDSALASLSRNTGVRVFVALPVLRDGCVIGAILLARTPMTWAKATYADRWNLAASGSVLLGVLILASLASAAFVVRPIRRLVEKANAIRAGAKPASQPAVPPRIAELFALSESLDAMAKALAEKNDALRAFAASVSHEFKTPLASIRGAIELLEDPAMAADQRAKFLGNVSKDADRLTRLVQRLLELTRAEAGTGGGTCDPAAVLAALATGAVEFPERSRGASAAMPAEALSAALGHLIENAFQHGGTKVTLALSGGDVTVTDDGPGISAANRAKVFDTFFTTARATGGTGMGLSIARALMRAFGGDLTLDPPGAKGAAFRLRLP